MDERLRELNEELSELNGRLARANGLERRLDDLRAQYEERKARVEETARLLTKEREDVEKLERGGLRALPFALPEAGMKKRATRMADGPDGCGKGGG